MKPPTPCRRGVLAFGDSITNAGGELQWGVALHSWAHWVARGTGLPLTNYAVDGARVTDVIGEQIPAFEATAAEPLGRYDLGCLYIGVNDVRALDWDVAPFEQGFGEALDFLVGRCERTLTMTAPLDLGRPRAGARMLELNAAIERVAAVRRAIVVDLRDFGARNQVMTDHVHPTAFGQIAIAERALAALAADGLPIRVLPSTLIHYEIHRLPRLKSDITYLWRHAKLSAGTAIVALLNRLPL